MELKYGVPKHEQRKVGCMEVNAIGGGSRVNS